MRWLRPLELGAEALLVAMGVRLFTSHFATLANYRAGVGQLVSVDRQTSIRSSLRMIAAASPPCSPSEFGGGSVVSNRS